MTRQEYENWLRKEDFDLDTAIDDFDGTTAAHIAAIKNDCEVLEYIAQTNPKLINRTTDSGITPAQFAAEGEKDEAFDTIMKHTTFEKVWQKLVIDRGLNLEDNYRTFGYILDKTKEYILKEINNPNKKQELKRIHSIIQIKTSIFDAYERKYFAKILKKEEY